MPVMDVFTGSGVAPSVVSAKMVGSIIYVTFSEEMDPSDLVNTGNYSIPTITVQQASPVAGTNNTQVALTVTGFIPSTEYTVTVSNLKDKAGNLVA